MPERGSQIFGTIIFVLLISGLLYLIFFSNEKTDKGAIKMINITGNKLLSRNDYLSFTKLDDSADFKNAGLPVIKDRFLQHPYVENADVKLEGRHEVDVELKEKKMKAVLISGGEPFFITDNFQVIPLFPDTKFSDIPVISNLPDSIKVKPLSEIKSDVVTEAFKIIDATKITNKDMANHLAEINLRKGGDIVLTFSGVKPPVIYGKTGAAKKAVYLDIMWDDMIAGKNLVENSEYIDLRFSNEVYIGRSEKTGLN